MTFRSTFLLLALAAPCAAAIAQSQSAPAKPSAAPHPKTATIPAKLPPFEGTWILNTQRSKMIQRINGQSKAIIFYNGKTWHYIHSHQDSPDEEPDQWQTTLIVDSPKYITTQGVDIAFHSRIYRQGNALIFSEYGSTLHGQKTRNTVKYTLENDGNTLIQDETAVGPLGPQHNLYVLEREGTQPSTK